MQNRKLQQTAPPTNSPSTTGLRGNIVIRDFGTASNCPINVQTPKGALKTYTLLDSGSQASLIVEEFADKIGLQGETSVLHLGTVNSAHEAKPSRKVAFNVGPLGEPNAREIAVKEAWTIPRLNLPSQRVTQSMIDSWPHLKGLVIPLVDSKNVTVLLGANVLDAILHTKVRCGAQGNQ